MRILSSEQARQLDRISIEEHGIPGIKLMGAAGEAIATEAISLLAEIHDPRIIILCGKGNNGGDGFAAAVHLIEYNVQILCIVDENEIKNDAAHFHQKCKELGIPIAYNPKVPFESGPDLIIDAILGTGTKGELRKDISKWSQWVNKLNCSILSVDCPTGLDGNIGSASQDTIKASTTVTVGYSKLGLHLNQGPEFSGKVKVVDIGFPDVVNDLDGFNWSTFEQKVLSDGLPKIHNDTYKHKQGKVLIVAGSKGMTGAAVLSTFGALRSGAGLTVTCAPRSIEDIYEKTIMEGMTLGCPDKGFGYFIEESYENISSKFDWCDVVIVGPGLGENDATKRLVEKVILNSPKPLVIDADAFRVFDGKTELFEQVNVPFIITPHEGEFCRLLGINRDEFNNGFPSVIEDFMESFPGVLVLKNAPTISLFNNNAVVNISGNPGMATAGMGDVLTGVIGTLVAQSADIYSASQSGVYVHGLAADRMAEIKGYRGLIASDLLNELSEVIREFD